jgi:medium-chain acyl-[acyl-carrier-protein] hydrolase
VQSAWFIRRQPRPAAGFRLFCFPYAGAGAAVYRDWAAALPSDIDVVSVQLPGRETRLREPPLTALPQIIDALAREIEPWLDRPAAFFGHSMGGLVAFELARRLRRSGGGPRALVVSAQRGPRLERADPPLHVLDDVTFVGELQRRYGGIPEEVLRHRDLLELLLPTLRADVRALETYRYQGGPLLECPIVALRGTTDLRTRAPDVAAWASETRGAFTSHVIEGGHFFLQTAQPQVLEIVRSCLAPAHREHSLAWSRA